MNKSLGLTLIEVLIALAIISIAMMAVIKTTGENIRATAYLENKTIALWVAEEIMTEIQLGLIHLSDEKIKEQTVMLEKKWYWQARQQETPNKKIKKIIVDVFMRENDSEDGTPIVSLEGYVLQA